MDDLCSLPEPDAVAVDVGDVEDDVASGLRAAVASASRRERTEERLARDHVIDELTAVARAKAAAVSVAVAELVDAVAALQPLEGGMSATWRQWVAWQCGLTTRETSRVCSLATTLPDLPLIDAAFRAGEISDDVAALLVSVATPENEAYVLDTTANATGRQLQQLVRDFRRLQRDVAARVGDEDVPETARSEAWWGWDESGRFRGGWDLRAERGATVEAALEAALAELRPSEEDVDLNPVEVGELAPEERSVARRVDALGALADTYLAGEADDGLLPESHQVILRRPTAADGTDAGPVDSLFPTLVDGPGAVDRRLAEMMACGASVITQDMIAGFPVSAPTTVRPFNRTQRRALRARDRTCRYPGCGRTKHLHAHHTAHWEHTHRTSVASGVLLCHQHHVLVHLRRHAIELDADGVAVVTRADGSILRGVTPRRQPCEQAGPATGERRTGAAEPLTHFARDVIIATWARAAPTAAGAGGGGGSRAGPGPAPG